MKKGVSLAKGEIAKEDYFDSNVSLVETWYAQREHAQQHLIHSTCVKGGSYINERVHTSVSCMHAFSHILEHYQQEGNGEFGKTRADQVRRHQ